MSLFSIFKAEVDIENFISIYVGGKPNSELTNRLGQVIGNLIVISALIRDLKEAHQAYQHFADLFDYKYHELQGSGRWKDATATLETQPDNNSAITVMLDIWSVFESTLHYVTVNQAIRRCDPSADDKRYGVLRRVLHAKPADAGFEVEMGTLQSIGPFFLDDAAKVLPAIDTFKSTIRDGHWAGLTQAASDVTRVARATAQNCDALMLAVERMHTHTTQELRRVVPTDPYYLPGLQPEAQDS